MFDVFVGQIRAAEHTRGVSMARRRVLIIEPHSDDGAISSGALLTHLSNDSDIFTFLVAASETVSSSTGAATTRKQRLEEFSRYVDRIGATWITETHHGVFPLDFDTRLDTVPRHQLVSAIEDCVTAVDPSLLITLGPSFHHDHTIVYESTVAALRPTAQILPSEVLIAENPTYVHTPYNWQHSEPDTFFPLTERMLEEKLSMINDCFPSQIRDESDYLSPAGIRKWSLYRGFEARSVYAEAFSTLYRRFG